MENLISALNYIPPFTHAQKINPLSSARKQILKVIFHIDLPKFNYFFLKTFFMTFIKNVCQWDMKKKPPW